MSLSPKGMRSHRPLTLRAVKRKSSVLLIVAGMADNVLKPLLLGRGVDAPMPVVLLGALGGMATNGILGMFIGATLLSIGYRIFMAWVNEGLASADK